MDRETTLKFKHQNKLKISSWHLASIPSKNVNIPFISTYKSRATSLTSLDEIKIIFHNFFANQWFAVRSFRIKILHQISELYVNFTLFLAKISEILHSQQKDIHIKHPNQNNKKVIEPGMNF